MSRSISWVGVVEELSARFPQHERNGDEELTLSVSIEERMWKIRVRPLDAGGHAWLELMGQIAPTSTIAPAAAAYMNWEFTVGSLCIYQGILCMRQTLPLLDLQSESLFDAISALTTQAAFVRAIVGKPPEQGDAFVHQVT
jgi:hypothetical protein